MTKKIRDYASLRFDMCQLASQDIEENPNGANTGINYLDYLYFSRIEELLDEDY